MAEDVATVESEKVLTDAWTGWELVDVDEPRPASSTASSLF